MEIQGAQDNMNYFDKEEQSWETQTSVLKLIQSSSNQHTVVQAKDQIHNH